MASLIAFHKWLDKVHKDIRSFNGHSSGGAFNYHKVTTYKDYLEKVLKIKCKDNGTAGRTHKFSHWGSNAHACFGKFGDDIDQLKSKATKITKVSLSQWLRKHHPEILNEYQKASSQCNPTGHPKACRFRRGFSLRKEEHKNATNPV